jgi:hypothetical protein
MRGIDISEDRLAARAEGLLEILLADRATGGRIIWATDHYAQLGAEYAPDREITVESITGPNNRLIQPRVAKTTEQRWDRTKDKAEVFTPSWLCNDQNNRVDAAWFGRPGVFNTPQGTSWIEQPGRIQFESRGSRTWKSYVDDRRLEVACGEAPYLVSRYDATTGDIIGLNRRVGLLDRKLRVVTENADDGHEWRNWARRAVESVYGYEYHGDSLLLARENILATYVDYSSGALGEEPSTTELKEIATVVTWNLWQMDALTGLPPFQAQVLDTDQLDIFGDLGAAEQQECVIRDWRAKRTHNYRGLMDAREGAV